MARGRDALQELLKEIDRPVQVKEDIKTEKKQKPEFDGTIRKTVIIPRSLNREIKEYAMDQDCSDNDIFLEAIHRILRERPPIPPRTKKKRLDALNRKIES